MNRAQTKILLIVVAAAVATAGMGYWLAKRGSDSMDASHPTTSTTEAEKVLYWYDPMEPSQHFDKPGKSPFMDMQLVAKYADGGGANATTQSGVQIDPGVTQNLGIRLASVQRGMVAQPLTIVGSIGFNQRDIAIVQTRSAGFVNKVYQRAPGDVVKQGAAIVDLLVPEWIGGQTEFLALRKSGEQELVNAARQRLMLLGMTSELIARVESSGQAQTSVTITTPIAGVIASLDVRAGMTLSAGATLATVNGLDTVWLEAAVPEAQSTSLTIDKIVNAQLVAYPGEIFSGRVIAVLPETNAESRTVRVRVELRNSDGRLRSGQFAQVSLAAGDGRPVLFVPSEAVIRSGTRNIVIVAAEHHRYQPVEVQLGAEAGGKTTILAGVEEGQQVVASGQFLIDSEASLQGVLTRLNKGDQP
jgi:membrane fusion protein, copper/silver efflux system